ncbi:craniofacial development protein 2-like [Palaemon carinicauda]|uniref:craniofacial development protein 2-like n=1 Tax=Palaemon carinicauda TaxID=392227 RepID=UPI0035B58B6B
MMMTSKAEKELMEWKEVNTRLLLVKYKLMQCNMSLLVYYAPTNDSPEEMKDEYYEELQNVIDEIPERGMEIVMGDLSAKVGRNNQGIENVMSVEGLGEVTNENRAHFMNFCSTNNLHIAVTVFQHKYIHKYTWTSPCDNYKNQIHHIAINKEQGL